MIRRAKQPSLSRTKRTPKRISSVTIGTHVRRGSRAGDAARKKRASSQNSRSLGFSNPKKAARAHRGVVKQVLPRTSSGESDSDYSRRVNKPHYTKTIQRNAKIKTTIIMLVILAIMLIAAGGVGVFAYAGSVSDKMSLTDTATKAALTAPVEKEPYYLLLTGEFYEAGKAYNGPDLIILVRIDEIQKKVALVSIPSNLQVSFNDGSFRRISEAQMLGGDAALIDKVEAFAGISVSHFIKTDKENFVQLVNTTGGVVVDVSKEVDDPPAGSYYIPAGQQKLDGEQALTLCRATNFTDSEQTRADNQCKVAVALATNLLNTNIFGLVFTLDGIAGLIQTDYNINALMALIGSLGGITADQVNSFQVPGETVLSTSSGIEYFISRDADWEAMKAALKVGEDPNEAIVKPEPVDPASFSITVRNGSGVTGDAARVAGILQEAGFQVEETGNADQQVYGETLVVYHQDDKAAAAETVVARLGIGRAIPSDTFYAFETDVLVVVGKDWKPLN